MAFFFYPKSGGRCVIFIFNSGDDSEGVTPLPIPNREVKPFSDDGTIPAGGWESRRLPDLL